MPASIFDLARGNLTDEDGHLSAREAAKLATAAAARYYAKANEFRFEPFTNFNQFLILCCMIGLVLAMLYFWRNVLKVCLGDDKIRMDKYQFIYWLFFQCCGCCDGEWTRCLSSWCCWCYPEWRGRNLKRKVGESLGLYPISIRMQNIVVGGLPQDRYSWFPKSPDLFLQVIADENSPTLNTEVVSEANTECVQFTSILTLLVKNNPGDDPVRIFVKKMHLTGSSEVCDCSVNPARLILWAKEGKKVRIQMGGTCRRKDALCMPWILMDLSIPPESMYLRKEVGIFTPIITSHLDKRPSRSNNDGSGEEEDNEPGLLCGIDDSDGRWTLPLTTSTGFYAVTDANKFMELHPLVNAKGQEVNEDRDMSTNALLNKRSWVNVLACWVVLLLMVFLMLHVFTSSCLSQYRRLEAIKLESHRRHLRFKPDREELVETVEEVCNYPPLGIRVFFHIIHADSRALPECFPPLKWEVCKEVRETISPNVFFLQCPAWTCSFDDLLSSNDIMIVGVFLLSLLCVCMCKMWENHSIRREVLHPGRSGSRSNRRVSAVLAGTYH